MAVPSCEELKIDVTADGDIARVSLRGDLDMSTAPRLIAEIRRHITETTRRIDVDCNQVAFVDSAGIRSLIVSRNEAHRAGIALGLVNPSRPVRRVLDMTGLASLLAPQPS